jgi:hypothetical protein
MAVFFKLEKLVGEHAIRKNLQQMGYSIKESKMIVNAHRKALKMCKEN